MPIYEFYCPDNHRIYSFLARTAAERGRVPKCPDDPSYRMVKLLSPFAIGKPDRRAGADPKPAAPDEPAPPGDPETDDPRTMAAMTEMERAVEGMDEENPDPRTLGRLMRRMAELSGEKIEGGMEEMVRKLEEGRDPEELDEELSSLMEGEEAGDDDGTGRRAAPPSRDPHLYDYD